MRAARYLNLQPSLITSIVSCIEQDYIYTVEYELLFDKKADVSTYTVYKNAHVSVVSTLNILSFPITLSNC